MPPIMILLSKHELVDQYDLSSLKMCTTAAAPLGPEVERLCAERLPHLSIKQVQCNETPSLRWLGFLFTQPTQSYCHFKVQVKVCLPPGREQVCNAAASWPDQSLDAFYALVLG